jgi:uncharacterized protein YbaA (DUF1428 family)
LSYVDGFVTPVPQDRLEDYRQQADRAAQIWREHGALEVVECVADDVAPGEVTSLPRGVQARDGKRSCSRGSATNRASSATASTPP